MLIRRMEQKDLEQVLSIENEIFESPWKFHDFENSMANPQNIYLVVEEDEEIIAYCGLWGVAGEGQIYNVAVKEKFRNNHIALSMLKELISLGKQEELSAFTLEVRISNESAIKLYHNLGFKDVGIRKKFYENPKEDAIIMWL